MVTQGIKAIPELLSTPHMRSILLSQTICIAPFSVMFAIEYQFFGTSPMGYHFFNALLCGLCYAFLFLINFSIAEEDFYCIYCSIDICSASHT